LKGVYSVAAVNPGGGSAPIIFPPGESATAPFDIVFKVEPQDDTCVFDPVTIIAAANTANSGTIQW
jgi:hypothetical protein